MTRAFERARETNHRGQPRAGDCVAVGAFWSDDCRPMRSVDWASAIAFRPKRPTRRAAARVQASAPTALALRA